MQRSRSLRLTQILLACALVSFIMLFSGCGGDSHAQQQASQARGQLDQQIQHARAIGVPQVSLQPVTQQEAKLNSTSAPFSLFNDKPDTDYYNSQTSQYQHLLAQVQEVVSIITGQDQGQAQQDMQRFHTALNTPLPKGLGNVQVFTQRYNTDEALLKTAQLPKDYLAVSNDANIAITALGLMGTTASQLVTFQKTITQMSQAHLDVTLMQSQYSSDVGTLNKATSSGEFQNLDTLINAQYQLAVTNSIQALPYVGAAKLSEFKTQLGLLKTYGMDASAYQTLYNNDFATMGKAHTIAQFLAVSNQIDTDMASMHDDLVQGGARYLVGQIDRQAKAWGNAHLYHDSFDGKNYILTAGYTMDGIGYWLNREQGWAWQPSDWQSDLDDDNTELFNLQMLEQDYSDHTPYNQVHATDLQMMQHYPSLQHGTVLMVSEVEQALRFYKDGKLIRSFLVTTGQPDLPSLPGVWSVQNLQSPTEFTSPDPPGSPFWYPPTHINYAILYHWGGFFVHDAWWRVNFGPGTDFPHYDVGGDAAFANQGSHGCVNMQEDDAAWVYNHVDWTTQIAIY